MARKEKPRSSTAALVENRSVANEEHPERLPIEETWPAENLREQDDSARGYETEAPAMRADSTAHPDNQRPYFGPEDFGGRVLGLSSSGPFIAPVTPPDSKPPSTRSEMPVT